MLGLAEAASSLKEVKQRRLMGYNTFDRAPLSETQ